MKKIILIILLSVSIVVIQKSTGTQEAHAQEVGLGDIIFENPSIETTSGFLMNELSYSAIKLHMKLSGKETGTDNYEGEKLTTIKRLEELTKTDVIELLNISADKEVALSKYLNDSSKELQKGDAISAYMKQEMAIFKGDMQSCLIEKNISDKAYFDAIDRYDENIMEASLADSITYESCVTENRIKYNAEIGIANKLVFYLGLLQKKYDILFAKQDILSKNFGIFRDNILPDLIQIDELLKEYKL